MAIVMHKKIDNYLKNPAYFSQDLQRQRREWVRNVVQPLGSHYEASKEQVKLVKEMADNRRKAQQQRLQRIELYGQMVMGVLFLGIDIVAAGALSKTQVLTKKFGSLKDFNSFRNNAVSFETAWKQFTAQSPTVLDAILADVDGKLKGLVSTGTVKGAAATIQSLTSDITAAIPKPDPAQVVGALAFQNSVDQFYSKTCDSIYDTYVNLVRDSGASEASKRKVIEFLVHTPFCKPPDLSLASFADSFKNYFEVAYWCQLVSRSAMTEHKSKTGTSHWGLIDGYLADMINERLLFLTGHIFTHTGGKKPTGKIREIRDKGLPHSRTIEGVDMQVVWDGWCSKSHSAYCNTIMADAFMSMAQPLFYCQGISSAQVHG